MHSKREQSRVVDRTTAKSEGSRDPTSHEANENECRQGFAIETDVFVEVVDSVVPFESLFFLVHPYRVDCYTDALGNENDLDAPVPE